VAIQFVREQGVLRDVVPAKFLQAAWASCDLQLFYNVYKFMEQRNIYLHNRTSLQGEAGCEVFMQHFSKHFA
jgi:hypothetical protein